MSGAEFPFARLDALVESLVADGLTADEHVEFETLLSSDQHARQRYLERMFLVGQLRWMSRGPAAPQPAGRPASSGHGASSGRGASASDAAGLPGSLLSFLGAAWEAAYSSPRLVVMILGGVLTTYFIVMLALIPFAQWTQQNHTEPPDISRREIADKFTATPGAKVGSFTATAEARWSFRSAVPSDEIARVGRRYELARGRADIVLTRGVRVAIEGPARWELSSEQRLKFEWGKLAAQVPPKGIGFTVVTPSAEVVDLGTEFGVEVDNNGSTELHVIKGQVEVKPASGSADRPTRGPRIVAGQAVRVSVSGQTPARIAFDAARFDAVRPSLSAEASRDRRPDRTFPDGAPIWLGNLFDDPPNMSLAEAMRTDIFKASPTGNDTLGVERVTYSGDRVQEIAPGVRFDLTNSGWSDGAHGHHIANDSWSTDRSQSSGGLRLQGEPMTQGEPKIEEGIGTHANSLLTFSLAEIRAAGKLEGRKLQFVCDLVGVNDTALPSTLEGGSVHLMVLTSTRAGVRAALVDGAAAKVARKGDCWSVTSAIGEPVRAGERSFSVCEPIEVNDEYLTLICTSAGIGIHQDHGAWIGARLEVVP